MSVAIDYAAVLAPNLPGPAGRFGGFPRYNFVGGHNAPESIQVDGFIAAVQRVLAREGSTLATYGLESGPQGYRPLREFLAEKLKRDAGIVCAADDLLITSGSLQGLDLVNEILLQPGDTVIAELFSYGGAISRMRKKGAKVVGVPLDEHGLRMDALAETLAKLRTKGIAPKYIYTIPTVQNPTGSILPEDRRREMLRLSAEYGVPIFEDECYSDLVWSGERPPALYALDRAEGGNRVIHIGSFSKSIAPALRIGYILADWPILSRLLAVKTDGGSGALEQMVLAEFCRDSFQGHVTELNGLLQTKLDALLDALSEQFGTEAEFSRPPGGIFLWVKLPERVDTLALYKAAAAEGVAINPGPEWSVEAAPAASSLRLCFANPDVATIREGVAKLAEICHREFGVPARGANVDR
ncbi:MAG: PLP-dependent aminotransferase family protein [Alphaproteobacteria bacterium]|nr:PLP-dependent aminotransferase family protein [Alphaproteobacteria bacterium]